MAIAGAGLHHFTGEKNAARNWEEKSEERVRRRWWRVCEMRTSFLDLISLSHENHEVIDGKHLMEREIFKMIILGVDWWRGKAIGRRRRKSISWVCDSPMNVLFKWVVPTDCRKTVSGWEQGKKVRKGFGRWQRVCCRSRDRVTTWTPPDLTHSSLLPPHASPTLLAMGTLETSPNLPSLTPKAWQRNGEIRHRMSPLHNPCKMWISELEVFGSVDGKLNNATQSKKKRREFWLFL